VLVTAINKLESVQRAFTKRLRGMSSMTYDDRLKLLGLERLELRRLHTDLITCYKIINNLVAVQFDSLFKFATNTNTRGHSLKLMLPDSRMPFRYVLLLCGTDCRLMLCAHPLCQRLKVVLKILI